MRWRPAPISSWSKLASDAQIVTGAFPRREYLGVSVVSLSFGAPESEAASLGWYPAFESIGAQHPKVTFVVSSGDEHNGEIVDYPRRALGRWPWVEQPSTHRPPRSSIPRATTFPKKSGTRAMTTPARGGVSSLLTAPSWQPSVTGNSSRTTPDVSFHGYGSC